MLRLLLFVLALPLAAADLTLATYVQSPDQVRKAQALVSSLRQLGGAWKDAPVHVVVADPEGLVLEALAEPGVHLHRTDAPPEVLAFPYAMKAWAASQVETLLGDASGSLAWFDPETLVLGPPRHLVLPAERTAAVQPVFKANAVALPFGAAPDAFWRGILEGAGVAVEALPRVATRVEGHPIHAYYNCEIFSVRPRAGILRAWRRQLQALLASPVFLKEACADQPHRIFLHQAVLSACLAARVQPGSLEALPLEAAYPFNLHDELPGSLRRTRAAGLEGVILEQVWDEDPGWRNRLVLDPGQARWAEAAWARYHEVAQDVFREEHPAGCNSLLVRTSAGDVLVDAGGTLHPSSHLWTLHQGRALRAVLLTHGHADHRAGLERWLQGREVPVVAHRSHPAFLATLDRIGPLLEARGALLQGRPARTDPPLAVCHANVLFDTTHRLREGDVTFEVSQVGGETPDTCLVWIPERKVLCLGDDYFGSFPALATPRGTQPRPAVQYLAALDRALALAPEVLVPGHGEPLVGRERIQRQLKRYRDALAWVLEATLKGLNEGRPVEDLVQSIRLPDALRLPEGYGRVAWAVRAIALEHVGGFDGRVVSLFETPVRSIHPLLVEAAGGAGRIQDLAEARLRAGQPLEALHLLDLLANPGTRSLTLRLEVLKTLQAGTRNYFQRAFLAAEIRRLETAR